MPAFRPQAHENFPKLQKVERTTMKLKLVITARFNTRNYTDKQTDKQTNRTREGEQN